MTTSNKNIALIVAPHQDDEVIGCGGTILRMIESGIQVYVQHVYKGSSGIKGRTANEAIIIRNRESNDAAHIAGYIVLPNLGFSDRKHSDEANIIYELVKVFRKYPPTFIFSPHRDEQDYEHQIVARATWEAGWLTNAEVFPEIKKPNHYSPKTFFGYEVWRPISIVSAFVDVTNQIETKMKMLKAFKSQMDLTSWENGAIGLNAYRGAMLQGRGYVEAFTIRNLSESITANILNLKNK